MIHLEFMISSIGKLGIQAKQTHSKYALCDHCMGRTFAKRAGLVNHRQLGARLRKAGKYAKPKKCHVCKGVFAQLDKHCDEMIRLTSDIQFSTFLIGTTLKTSVHDADDNVRAKYKLRGTHSAKSDITSTLSKIFARKTRTRTNALLPDITIKIDFRDTSISIESRSIFVQGRYTKELRGLSQKADKCKMCIGKGCMHCAHRGIIKTNSVEGKISEILCDTTSSKQAKFLWCGSEESKSAVTGRGRPFIAKLRGPSKRWGSLLKKRNLGDGVTLYDLHYVHALPKTVPKFSFTTTIQIATNENIDAKMLRELRTIVGNVIDYGIKTHVRKIHSVTYKKINSKHFQLGIRTDSGFPIKRFVECSNVSPNLTDLLEVKCKYIIADFADIDLVRTIKTQQIAKS